MKIVSSGAGNSHVPSVAQKEGRRTEEQAGSRLEKSIVDHLSELRHLIQANQSHCKSKPVRCGFVDSWKAYDVVGRDLLVRRLAELGVHGSMLQAILQMCWDALLVPKAGTALGPEIPSQCGVKQGDSLSQLLFGYFSIDELECGLGLGGVFRLVLWVGVCCYGWGYFCSGWGVVTVNCGCLVQVPTGSKFAASNVIVGLSQHHISCIFW